MNKFIISFFLIFSLNCHCMDSAITEKNSLAHIPQDLKRIIVDFSLCFIEFDGLRSFINSVALINKSFLMIAQDPIFIWNVLTFLSKKFKMGEVWIGYYLQSLYTSRAIHYGINQNEKHKTLLQTFIYESVLKNYTPNKIKFLVASGFELNKPNNAGDYPIHQAILAGKNGDIINELIFNGADVNSINTDGNTPLMLVLKTILQVSHYKSKNIALKIIQLLIECNANINIQNGDGKTILIESVIANEYEIIKLLLEKNAQVQLKDNKGLTALDHARNYLTIVPRPTHSKKIIYLLKTKESEYLQKFFFKN